MLNKTQSQDLANAINTLENILAKPTTEDWRTANDLSRLAERLNQVVKELDKTNPA